jgi:hypothetical protein
MHHGQGLSGPNFVPFCGLGTGFPPQLVSAAGIAWHQLPLLLLGSGVIGGCGLGLGYISPVSMLICWFP